MRTRTDAPQKVRDPVCGMRFRVEKAASTAEHLGKTRYFCTDACRRQFEQDPDRYADEQEPQV